MDLNQENLTKALEAAGSQADASIRASGEAQLEVWQTLPGFCSLLQQTYLNRGLGLPVRWLAVIFFKNNVNARWRRTSINAILAEEKAYLRAHLFDGIHEPNRQLNAQIAATIAKIARLEFPRDWPGAFETITQRVVAAINAMDLTQMYNILQILNAVLKDLAAVRIGRAKPMMQEQAPQLTDKVGNIYFALISDCMSNDSMDLGKLEVGYLAFKVGCRLICEGYENSHRSPQASNFFERAVAFFRGLLEVYSTRPSDIVAKFLKRYGKFYHQLFDTQPISFILMPKSLQAMHLYLTLIESRSTQLDVDDEYDEQGILWSKVLIQGMLLFKRTMQVITKPGSTSSRSRTGEERQEARHAQQLLAESFYTPETISHLTTVLLNHYMSLGRADLEDWKSEPEEFFNEEAQQSWEYQLRPCAAKFYEDIIIGFRDVVGQQVLIFIESSANQSDILLKDCSLQALQYGATVLQDSVDFDDLLVRLLVPLGQASSDPNYRILRRRISLVISEWVALKCSKESRVTIYHLLMSFLDDSSPLNDLVVQLYAIHGLRYAVDDWMFDIEGFLPFVDPTFGHLFKLLTRRVHNVETKVSLLQVVSVLVEQLQTHVAPYLSSILALLPPVWDEQTDNHFVKGVVMQVLTGVVTASRESSTACYSIAIPVLEASLDMNSPLHTYLFEDALPLWKALAENAPNPTEALHNLVRPLLTMIETSTENLTTELDILGSYLLLDPNLIMDSQLMESLLTVFKTYIPDMTHEAIMSVLQVVELMTTLQSFEQYANSLTASGLFVCLLGHMLNKEVSTSISQTKILTILGRMAVSAPALLWQMLGVNQDMVLKFWLERFDRIGHPKDRKICALGVTSLLTIGEQAPIRYLKQYVDLWAELLDEIVEENGDATIYYGASDIMSLDQAMTPEDKRKYNMNVTLDPVHKIALKEVIQQTIHALIQSPQHRQVLESQNSAVLESLNLIMNDDNRENKNNK